MSNVSEAQARRMAEAHQHMPTPRRGRKLSVLGEEQTVFVDHVQGCRITDCDGKEYVDFRLGYGPIILGYRDSRVDAEVIAAITELGTISGFSTPMDVEVVSRIKSLCPNIDKMRFANSAQKR